MKNFGKYLLLILAFLGISEISACNFTSSEIKEEQPFSSEDLRAATFSLFVFRENSFPELTDLSENQYFATSSVKPLNYLADAATSEAVFSFYKRDLRRDISHQIFPKHFFL